MSVRSLENGAPVARVVVVSTSTTGGLLDWNFTDESGDAGLFLPSGARVAVHDETSSYSMPVLSSAGAIIIPFPDAATPFEPPLGAPIQLDITVAGVENTVVVSDGCRSVEFVSPPGLVEFQPSLACGPGGTVTIQAVGFALGSGVSFDAAVDVVPSGTIALVLDADFEETLPVSLTFPGEVLPFSGNANFERDALPFGAARVGSQYVNANTLVSSIHALGRADAEALRGDLSGSLALPEEIAFYVEARQLDTSGIALSLPLPPYARAVQLATDDSVSWEVSGMPDWTAVLVQHYDQFDRRITSTDLVHAATRALARPAVPECLQSKRRDPAVSRSFAEVAVRDASFHLGLETFPGYWSADCTTGPRFGCYESVAAEVRPSEYLIWTSLTFASEP